MLGAAPHPHWRREQRGPPSGSRQSRTQALCSRQPTTHLRVARALAASSRLPLFFRELPLLTRPQLAQPLLSTADSAGNSVLSSPLGVTVADSQPCSGMRGVSKDRVRLAPGSIPAHADPCGDDINIGMASKALQVRHSYATSADCTPCRSEHVTGRRRPFSRPCHAASCRCLCMCYADHEPLTALRCNGNSKEQISSSWFWRGLHFSSVNGALSSIVC